MNTLLNAYLILMNSTTDEEGQDLVEYVLILGLIAIAAVVGIRLAGTGIQGAWNTVATLVNASLTAE